MPCYSTFEIKRQNKFRVLQRRMHMKHHLAYYHSRSYGVPSLWYEKSWFKSSAMISNAEMLSLPKCSWNFCTASSIAGVSNLGICTGKWWTCFGHQIAWMTLNKSENISLRVITAFTMIDVKSLVFIKSPSFAAPKIVLQPKRSRKENGCCCQVASF